jgi:hypothetical protein
MEPQNEPGVVTQSMWLTGDDYVGKIQLNLAAVAIAVLDL